MQAAMAIFGVILLLFIMGLIFVIVFSGLKKKTKRCSAQAQGQLIQILNNSNRPGRLFYVYSYRANGTEYRLKTFESTKMTNRVGDTAVIWYNPDKPQDAQLLHHSGKAYTIMIIIGVVMLLMGILPIIVGIIAAQLQYKGG